MPDTTQATGPPYYTGLLRLRYATNWLVTVVASIVFASLGVLVSPFDRRGRWSHACGARWGAVVLGAAGVHVDLRGAEHLEPDRTYVLVANHHSLFDIPVMLAALPLRFRMLAKASLFRIPFMGWYLSRAGYVPVERSDPRKAAASLDRAAEQIRAGHSVLIFAEGTRSPEGELRRFKRGSFRLARATGLPIVPVAVVNSGRLLPRGARRAEPGVVRLRVGHPISPDAEPGLAELSHRVRREILRLAGPGMRDAGRAGAPTD